MNVGRRRRKKCGKRKKRHKERERACHSNEADAMGRTGPDRNNKMLLVLISLLFTASVSCKGEESGKKLVCYYANWAIYRPGLAKFTPENIDPFLCTHLIYAFAGMNKDHELKPFDSYNDVQLGNFKKFTNLKSYNPKLKVMIAVGGWNEGSKRFSKMVESSEGRGRFVRGAISFLRKHGFDGLDLDWEYPGSRDGAQDGDKEGYAQLVEELRSAFEEESSDKGRPRLLLTMAVPAGKEYIDRGYDVPSLAENLDFFNLLTYDYHTGHEATVNHHAPLREEPGLEDWNPNKLLHVEWTVRYYVKLGCPAKKLVLGVPTYGRSFTLEDPGDTQLGAPAQGPGEKGNATREAGYLAYYEICQMIQDDDWELEAPYPHLMGPFAYKRDQWVGFDDEDIILEKTKFIWDEGLGGGMVWTLDNDDFRGGCYGERSPLVATLKSGLQSRASSSVASTPRPAVTTPRPAFTTPDPGAPFECEDEGFFPNPFDCKKYFWCLDSGGSELGLVAHAFNCPAGLHFNKQRDACDYAGNTVCKAKKKTTTGTTTARPRPKPRPRKTTVRTTPKPRPRPKKPSTTTTVAPPPAKKKEEMDSQSLSELLQLLKQLGVNQIQDRLQEREYAAPQGRTTAEPLFVQYAQPNRAQKSKDSTPAAGKPAAARPRGPQFHVPAPEAEVVAHDDLFEEEEEEEDGATEAPPNFPFVYHTPSRHHRKKPQQQTTIEEKKTSTTAAAPLATTRRAAVVVVRPIPGERSTPITTTISTTTTTTRTTRTTDPPTRAAPRRRKPPRKEVVTSATGKPAVPATTPLRRDLAEHDYPQELRGPSLALLPDGVSVTCLRRGVHTHPRECNKFVVCVPNAGELDGFIHECPKGTRFVDRKSRCTPVEDEGCESS